jgi:ketosteroid isomerase-like protein
MISRVAGAAMMVLVLGVPAGLAAQEPAEPEVEREILAVQAAMRDAAQSLDADRLFTYVMETDIPPIIEDGRVLPTRAEARRSTARALEGLSRIAYDYDREDVTMLSPTVALWVGDGMARATLADGREISAPFAETMVLVRGDDGWKVLHAHRSAPGR